MAGIKWENYVVATTFLGNQIVIGKVDKSGQLADKSNDRTNQVVAAVAQHMERLLKNQQQENPGLTKHIFKFKDGSSLTFTLPEQVKREA